MGTTKAQRISKGAPNKVKQRSASNRAARRKLQTLRTERNKARRVELQALKAARNGNRYSAPGWIITIIDSKRAVVTRSTPRKEKAA